MRGVVAGLVLLLAARAHADTRRLAVIVGNDGGSSAQPALHYAESDARKVAYTLQELGGVRGEDLSLLQGRSLRDVEGALALARRKVSAWRAEATPPRIVLIFFFSGHSDGEALELGHERLDFADLRRWLAGVGADVRLAIVDSCRSGGLLEAKGGHVGPAFAIRLTDDVASTGEALLTSSAADEVALESREIRGSFFTHHFVSGLRGAADLSRDGRVTLAEAYQYAFARTVSSTANTTIGPQHPAYDYRLSGEGDVVLSDLSQRTAALDLPGGFDRILIHEQARDQVLAELSGSAAARVALPVGTYSVRAWRDHRVAIAQVSLRSGQLRALRADELQPGAAAALVVVKGAWPRRPLGLTFDAGAIVESGIAASAPVHAGLRVGVSAATPSGWTAALLASTGRGGGFWETTAFALGGYRLGLERGRFRVWGALEAGVGMVAQNVDGGAALRTVSFGGAPALGATVRVSPTVALGLSGQCLLGWIQKDGGSALLVLPAGSLGVYWTL